MATSLEHQRAEGQCESEGKQFKYNLTAIASWVGLIMLHPEHLPVPTDKATRAHIVVKLRPYYTLSFTALLSAVEALVMDKDCFTMESSIASKVYQVLNDLQLWLKVSSNNDIAKMFACCFVRQLQCCTRQR